MVEVFKSWVSGWLIFLLQLEQDEGGKCRICTKLVRLPLVDQKVISTNLILSFAVCNITLSTHSCFEKSSKRKGKIKENPDLTVVLPPCLVYRFLFLVANTRFQRPGPSLIITSINDILNLRMYTIKLFSL